MEYFLRALSLLAVVAALANIAINITAQLRLKMTFSCNIYITEYIMTAVMLFILLKNILSDSQIIILSIVFAIVWCMTIIIFKKRKMYFIRVFGIKKVMHNTLREKLEQICTEHQLDRTGIYIYGGDSKTPCNTIIFKNVDKNIRQAVTKEANFFLKTYSHDAAFTHIISVLADIAVIFIACSVFIQP